MGANAKITRGKTSARAKPSKPTKAGKPAAKPAKKVAAKKATAKKATPKPAKAVPAKKPATLAAKKPATPPKKAATATASGKKAATRGVAKKPSMAAADATATPAAAHPDVAPPTPAIPEAVDTDVDGDIADGDAEKKPGALARFGRGVGSLLAKVTGRKKKPVEDPTIEIVTDDIVATWPAGAKPPPPPGHDD